jgi:hypothetical protein
LIVERQSMSMVDRKSSANPLTHEQQSIHEDHDPVTLAGSHA